MRNLTEPKIRKHVKKYGFLSFLKTFGYKYGKKSVDAEKKKKKKKKVIDAAKSTSKRAIQKSAEATRDLSWNKIADKITSVAKSKEKEKTKKVGETYMLPEKRQQIINNLRLF